ncbi:hypothetical protein AHAS_Ahas02G0108100 [Arachis hypogaea]
MSEAFWFPDSGASHYITPDATNLLTNSPNENDLDQLYVGKGAGIPVLSSGSSILLLIS